MTATLEPTEPTAAAPDRRALSPHVALKRMLLLVNPLSGGVGPRAAEEAETLLSGFDIDARVIVLEGDAMDAQIDEALALKPDLLAVLAGDGTARAVADRAGPDGPLVAPLPGGTMNMLPKALYDTADWKQALERALTEGEERVISGGQIEGQSFYCAAILGTPALWAPAREALRRGRLGEAWKHAQRALRRAFSGRLRYSLDGARTRKSGALVLISPTISRALEQREGLEAVAMNAAGAGDALRLAAHAIFDDWRNDPSVRTRAARTIAVHSRSKIPALIDGEHAQLSREGLVKFTPRAFRALAPAPAEVDQGG